jgi:hypothetical protein
VLPVLVLIVAAGMAAVAIIAAQLRCVDSARDAARAAIRGEPAAVVQQVAAAAAPSGARVAVSYQGDRVTVSVSAEIHTPVRLVPAVHIEARAVGQLEPGGADGGGAG